jgi:hypothetical protein
MNLPKACCGLLLFLRENMANGNVFARCGFCGKQFEVSRAVVEMLNPEPTIWDGLIEGLAIADRNRREREDPTD